VKTPLGTTPNFSDGGRNRLELVASKTRQYEDNPGMLRVRLDRFAAYGNTIGDIRSSYDAPVSCGVDELG
jgi:hypothetical protein